MTNNPVHTGTKGLERAYMVESLSFVPGQILSEVKESNSRGHRQRQTRRITIRCRMRAYAQLALDLYGHALTSLQNFLMVAAGILECFELLHIDQNLVNLKGWTCRDCCLCFASSFHNDETEGCRPNAVATAFL